MEEEIEKYKHHCTVGDLLDFIEKHNISRDSKILLQRIEDVYFDKHNWVSIKKDGYLYHRALKMKTNALDGVYYNKEDYPSLKQETIDNLANNDIDYLKEQYTVAWSPVYYCDSKHLFIDSHY